MNLQDPSKISPSKSNNKALSLSKFHSRKELRKGSTNMNLIPSIRLFGAQIYVARVLLVRYQEQHAFECVTFLALKYDVLMISSTKHYVWMRIEPENIIGTDECKDLRILTTASHEVGAMRSIPAVNVADYFSPSKQEWSTNEMVTDDQDEGEGRRSSGMYSRNEVMPTENSGDNQGQDCTTDRTKIRSAKALSTKKRPAEVLSRKSTLALSDSDDDHDEDYHYDYDNDKDEKMPLCRRTSQRRKSVKQYRDISQEMHTDAIGSRHDEDDDYVRQHESTQQKMGVEGPTQGQTSFLTEPSVQCSVRFTPIRKGRRGNRRRKRKITD
uniref:AlNc14C4G615 protein n=1 Tax=Albugo laibachii Nc14 TaxID=890382 RepID=F0W0H3_9STRA|nr:AlNc14C4G615 [Albugo laibachii Nc14]|eukprot:CCA14545.1 AlNc14C4G615 [Albugo laibachii Nc14]